LELESYRDREPFCALLPSDFSQGIGAFILAILATAYMSMSTSMSMKNLYSANSRRSNLRRWRVSD